MLDVIPQVNLQDFTSNGSQRQKTFVQTIGDALAEIGFFVLAGHGVDTHLISRCYNHAATFFNLPEKVKDTYEKQEINGQRGYTHFGKEHAKDSTQPDLKEFYQIGRTLTIDHPLHYQFLHNIWPTEIDSFEQDFKDLYIQLERCAVQLLSACSLYLEQPIDWLSKMSEDSNTILRVVHYPPLITDQSPNSIRAAAHEDINLITLLCGATADGLEIMDQNGSWVPIGANHQYIIVDSGDMIQNLTNGLFKSAKHRVINPKDVTSSRFSIPMFVHPRNDIDLSPRQEFLDKTGNELRYESITAGDYLYRRLLEIGLVNEDSNQ